MLRTITCFLICLQPLLLSGCQYHVEEELYPQDPACETSALSYTANIRQLVDTHCAVSGCHVAGTGRTDLTTYAGLKQVADNGLMRQKVLIEKSMPPGGPLPDCELRQIEAWLNAGAPEN